MNMNHEIIYSLQNSKFSEKKKGFAPVSFISIRDVAQRKTSRRILTELHRTYMHNQAFLHSRISTITKNITQDIWSNIK